MEDVLIKVYIAVENKEEACAVANDIHDILNDNGITNSVVIE